MKKGTKAILLGTLLTAGVVGLISGWGRGRGWGHHGRGWGRRGGVGVSIGFGGGPGWRRRGYWGRGYWGPRRYYRGYREPAVVREVVIEKEKAKDWTDDRGKTYWKIINKSDQQITVRSDIDFVDLAPGRSKNLKRDSSFEITVESADGKLLDRFKSEEHKIKLSGE